MSEVKSREIEKNRIRDYLVRIAALQEELYRVSEECDFYCSGFSTGEIHISSSRFFHLINALGLTVVFDPNWSENHPNCLEAYSHLELNGKRYKVFCIMNKGGKE